MKNMVLPCDCRLRWNENEIELIMCNYHFYEYVDDGFTPPQRNLLRVYLVLKVLTILIKPW